MDRGEQSGPMAYPIRPDQDVRSLSGGVCNILVLLLLNTSIYHDLLEDLWLASVLPKFATYG